MTAIGEGLRAMHDALPVTGLPVLLDGGGPDRRRGAGSRGRAPGYLGLGSRTPGTRHRGCACQGPGPPLADKLVVCHGDACAPNTLITGNGRWSGHVNLGASESLTAGPTWPSPPGAPSGTTGPAGSRVLLDAYGVRLDAERTRYYRLLWALG